MLLYIKFISIILIPYCLFQISYVAQHKDMPLIIWSSVMATRGTAVYLVGRDKNLYNIPLMYDTAFNKWNNLKSMIIKRSLIPCLFLIGNNLCAVGGLDGSDYLSSMECLDVENETATWQISEEMKHPVAYASCATVGNSVILTGGIGNNIQLSSVWKWTVNGSWTQLANMQKKRNRHCTVTDGTRYLYVVGGSMKQYVERYDIKEDRWDYMAPCPLATVEHACVYMNDTIVMTGGLKKYQKLNTIYIYSVNANSWTKSSTIILQMIVKHAMVLMP